MGQASRQHRADRRAKPRKSFARLPRCKCEACVGRCEARQAERHAPLSPLDGGESKGSFDDLEAPWLASLARLELRVPAGASRRIACWHGVFLVAGRIGEPVRLVRLATFIDRDGAAGLEQALPGSGRGREDSAFLPVLVVET
jgi:hypothetical protein